MGGAVTNPNAQAPPRGHTAGVGSARSSGTPLCSPLRTPAWDRAWQSPGPHSPALPSPLRGTQPPPGLGPSRSTGEEEATKHAPLSYCCRPRQPREDRPGPQQPADDGRLPGDSTLRPELRPLPPAPCGGTAPIVGWHLAPLLPFPPPPFPTPLAQAERQPDPWGPARAGAARSQRHRPHGRQTLPTRPTLPLPPPLLLDPLLSLVGTVISPPPTFPQKNRSGCPGQSRSPSPELVRGSEHAARYRERNGFADSLLGLPGWAWGETWHPSPTSVLGWGDRLARTGCSLGTNGRTHTHTATHNNISILKVP